MKVKRERREKKPVIIGTVFDPNELGIFLRSLPLSLFLIYSFIEPSLKAVAISLCIQPLVGMCVFVKYIANE